MNESSEVLFHQLSLMLENSADSDITQYLQVLKEIVSCCKTQTFTIREINMLLQLMPKALCTIDKFIINEIEAECISNLMRCFRNCLGCRRNDFQEISFGLFSSMSEVLLSLRTQMKYNAKNGDIVILRCSLQVFGNLVCQNDSMKNQTWKLFTKESLFKTFLEDADLKIQEFTMMILYNCAFPQHTEEILSQDIGQEILLSLTNALTENLIDWGLLFLEKLLKEDKFMPDCYALLPVQNRLLVLDLIASKLSNSSDDSPISEGTIKFIKHCFIEYAMDIMRTCDSPSGDLKSIEIVKFLSILCEASISNLSECLKTFDDLLELAVVCLKSVHLLGKKSCNSFSAVSNLRDANDFSEKEIEDHPSFGFKKDLIKLIGNLCSECRTNQDRVRNLDGIPLLLDCCNLDARNPYIMQWCILAIRNLMKDNRENQKVLGEMTISEELASSSILLSELGLTVTMEEGRPVLKGKAFD